MAQGTESEGDIGCRLNHTVTNTSTFLTATGTQLLPPQWQGTLQLQPTQQQGTQLQPIQLQVAHS